jgi:hypothetical protein
MSTDRQKSFTARLSYGEYAVCFYELTLDAAYVKGYFRGKEIIVPGVKGYANLKDTNYLCLNNKLKKDEGPLLYFRYENGGYIIYVREQGPQYGKAIGISNGWLLTSDTPTQMHLTTVENQSLKITLDDFLNDTYKQLCLRAPGGTLQYYDFVKTDASFSYSYLVSYGGKDTIPLYFEIVEKNVPYLNNPGEI